MAARAKTSVKADDRLSVYRGKRDFKISAEPSSNQARPGRRLILQHHYATREHFDLRLEIDGVLASWAVTRGPSANPKDKRLAVRTEDHPLDYADFEGVIAAKQYGAGTVILWESTEYEPLNGDPAEALRKGQIKFRSKGERMRGAWVLVRMKTAEKRENWLLIKERDEFAESDDSLSGRYPRSIASGRERAAIERADEPAEKAAPPSFQEPALCRTVDAPPTDKGWLFEMKYDGYRLQIAVGGGAAKVFTRTGLDWTKRFPRLEAAARALPCRSALIDGEAVVFDGNGLSDFPALVEALEQGHPERIQFVAFDLMTLDGEALAPRPLLERKAALKTLMARASPPLLFGDYVRDRGSEMFEAVAKAGGEGIVAKRASSPYRGERGPDWLKIKTKSDEDVLLIGHMPSTKGEPFASLLAARRDVDGFVYLGRVGTGFARWRNELARLTKVSGATRPGISNSEKLPRGAVYWATQVPAEVAHSGWTGDAQMRHARLSRLREDLVETPRATPSRKKSEVKVTHADRIVFPDCGVTKGDVANYYEAIADRIAPHLASRVVSLLRAPEGVEAETFFQRHPLKGMTKGIIAVKEDAEPYFALDGATGLRTAAQFGAIEIHGRMTRVDALDKPDRLIFDLDPDPSVGFDKVKAAALLIRDALQAANLQSFALLSGGKGVHVIAPLDRSNSQEDVEAFASLMADRLSREKPGAYVATMSKKRRQGRIFIDWMRNQRKATAISPWSLRARASAPVACPIDWDELPKFKSAAAITLKSATERGEAWTQTFFDVQQSIAPAAIDFLRGS